MDIMHNSGHFPQLLLTKAVIIETYSSFPVALSNRSVYQRNKLLLKRKKPVVRRVSGPGNMKN